MSRDQSSQAAVSLIGYLPESGVITDAHEDSRKLLSFIQTETQFTIGAVHLTYEEAEFDRVAEEITPDPPAAGAGER